MFVSHNYESVTAIWLISSEILKKNSRTRNDTNLVSLEFAFIHLLLTLYLYFNSVLS